MERSREFGTAGARSSMDLQVPHRWRNTWLTLLSQVSKASTHPMLSARKQRKRKGNATPFLDGDLGQSLLQLSNSNHLCYRHPNNPNEILLRSSQLRIIDRGCLTLYYMLHNIAGRKMAGEVRIVP